MKKLNKKGVGAITLLLTLTIVGIMFTIKPTKTEKWFWIAQVTMQNGQVLNLDHVTFSFEGSMVRVKTDVSDMLVAPEHVQFWKNKGE